MPRSPKPLSCKKKKRGPLGQLMIEMGFVDEATVNRALAAQVGMDSITIADIDIDKTVIDLIPAQMAQAYRIIPTAYDRDTNTLEVALATPDNFQATDDLKTLMGYNVIAHHHARGHGRRPQPLLSRRSRRKHQRHHRRARRR